MSNVTYDQVLGILSEWEGSPQQKAGLWGQTYNFIIPPPPPPPSAIYQSDAALAQYIADHYTGDPIPIN